LQSLDAAMDEDVYLFDVRRTTRWERWGQDASQGQRNWSGQNPPSGAYINYYLKEAPAGPVKIRITDASGTLVRELVDREAEAGVNRAIWDMAWEGATPSRSSQSTGGFRGFGPSGPPALPGTYTATLMVGDTELSTSFELRGDPNVETTLADYQAQFDAAMKVRDLTSSVNELIDTVVDLNEQLEGLQGRLEDSQVEDLEQIVEQTGTAMQELEELDNKLRRPFPNMGYRQYPRLSEELRSLNGNILGAQARPTEGQLQVLDELDQEASERIAELNEIIATTIAELNELLVTFPKIMVGWGGGSR